MKIKPHEWSVPLPPVDRDPYTEKKPPSGLTKREYISLKLHTVLLDSESMLYRYKGYEVLESAAKEAVGQADKLIAELSKKKAADRIEILEKTIVKMADSSNSWASSSSVDRNAFDVICDILYKQGNKL